MTVSNGQLANQTTFNNAFVSKSSNNTITGVQDLNNTSDINSGNQITNLQRAVNGNIQNGRIFLYIANASNVSFSTNTLTLNDDLIINLPEAGFTNTVSATAFTIADGEHLYVTLDRTSNATITGTVAASIPSGTNGQDVIRLASRVGSSIIWYDNTYQEDGSSVRIGQGGAGGGSTVGGYQEKIGTGNGVTTSFNLTLFPINTNSIIVFSNTVQYLTTDWSYSSNQIDFVTAPANGVEIYVFYLTSGATITAPNPSVEAFDGNGVTTLFTLVSTPSSDNAVEVYVNGLIQELGATKDYTISADQITFNTAPVTGQRIIFRYV